MSATSPTIYSVTDNIPIARIGPYLLDEVIGRGSSGVVWRAFDELTGEMVAVKVLDETTVKDPLARARFVRECELVGAFSHAGLVRLRAAGATETGIDYLVMDLALGLTLMTRLSSPPPLSIAAGLAMVQEASEAVAAMHRAGWVHRDIKPANLVLDEQGHPRLLDFGLAARSVDEADVRLTRAGFFVGTPLYLAPEQLLGAPPAASMDVYALGAVLFEVLVGHPPFMGPTETLLAAKSTRDAPLYEGPAPVRDLLKASLSRHPEDRPVDAGAFADRLRRASAASTATDDLEQRVVPGARPILDAETVASSSPLLVAQATSPETSSSLSESEGPTASEAMGAPAPSVTRPASGETPLPLATPKVWDVADSEPSAEVERVSMLPQRRPSTDGGSLDKILWEVTAANAPLGPFHAFPDSEGLFLAFFTAPLVASLSWLLVEFAGRVAESKALLL